MEEQDIRLETTPKTFLMARAKTLQEMLQSRKLVINSIDKYVKVNGVFYDSEYLSNPLRPPITIACPEGSISIVPVLTEDAAVIPEGSFGISTGFANCRGIICYDNPDRGDLFFKHNWAFNGNIEAPYVFGKYAVIGTIGGHNTFKDAYQLQSLSKSQKSPHNPTLTYHLTDYTPPKNVFVMNHHGQPHFIVTTDTGFLLNTLDEDDIIERIRRDGSKPLQKYLDLILTRLWKQKCR
jgi:hypothetical protein